MSNIGELNWIELQTTKPEEAMALYNQLYGWTFVSEVNEHGDVYWLISNADKFPFGGILTLDSELQIDSRWVTYFQVEDVNLAVRVVEEGKGKIIKEPRDIKGVGRVAWLRDQQGAEFGVVAPINSNKRL